MLVIKENNDIHMTKGDTAYLNLSIDNYTPHDGDAITMTIRHSLTDKKVFEQTINPDDTFVIKHEDTANIPIGRYKYDVQLINTLGDVCTVIPKSKLCLEEEVTYE